MVVKTASATFVETMIVGSIIPEADKLENVPEIRKNETD